MRLLKGCVPAAVLILVGGLICVASVGTPAQARPAQSSCAGTPIAEWFHKGDKVKILNGCVTATGVAEAIQATGAVVVFALKPDAASRHLLNAHNTTLLGGFLPVAVDGRARIHGALLNGARVQIAGPLVHDLNSGWNDVLDVSYMKVLPAHG
jgi:hypothetical protein